MRRDIHPRLVSHAQQQQTSLRTVDRNLPNQFICKQKRCAGVKLTVRSWATTQGASWWRRTEALGIEFFSDGTDARLPRLSLLQLLVQLRLKRVQEKISQPIEGAPIFFFPLGITCRFTTSSLVAGVLDTYWIHSCPSSVHSLPKHGPKPRSPHRSPFHLPTKQMLQSANCVT